jgi:hypothetical protein
LDYVRKSAGGIGDLARALRDIGERLGMKVSVEISKYPKVKFRAPFESGRGSMRSKIEVNTYERSPALPLALVTHCWAWTTISSSNFERLRLPFRK